MNSQTIVETIQHKGWKTYFKPKGSYDEIIVKTGEREGLFFIVNAGRDGVSISWRYFFPKGKCVNANLLMELNMTSTHFTSAMISDGALVLSAKSQKLSELTKEQLIQIQNYLLSVRMDVIRQGIEARLQSLFLVKLEDIESELRFGVDKEEFSYLIEETIRAYKQERKRK